MYYQKQDYPANCVLLSSAMAIGMVTGDMPSPETMIELAKTNQSVVDPGRKMYLDEFVNYGVWDKGCRGADGAVFRRHRRQHALRDVRRGRKHASPGPTAGRPTRSGRSSGGVGGRRRSHRQHQHEHRLVGRRELQLAGDPNFTESGHDATVVSVDMKS